MTTSFNKKQECSKTYLLFDSSDGVEVKLSLHKPPSDTTRPIDAYMVVDCGAGFEDAVQRAAQSIYDARSYLYKETGPLRIAYDLVGLPSGKKVTGGSGGLAFAVALGKELLKKDPGPVAATGEIAAGGFVSRVEGIESKLKAAAALVPENGWILYPEENDGEIPDNLRRDLKDKGLHLRGVSNVAEAVEILFEPVKEVQGHESRKINMKKSLLLGGFLLLASCIVLGIMLSGNDREKVAPQEEEKESIATRPHQIIKKQKMMPRIESDKIKKKMGEVLYPDRDRVELTGDGVMVSQLAHMVAKELSQSPEILATGKISGNIKILWISEDPVNEKGDLHSTMNVAIAGLKYNDGKSESKLPGIQIEVKGNGPAGSLLDKAAVKIRDEILLKIKNGKKSLDKGFE